MCRRYMAMATTTGILVLLVLTAAPAVWAVDHIVGGSSGWTLGSNYSAWAASQTFAVGDNLVFNYDSTHQVAEVTQGNYGSCSSANSIKTYNDGNTKIALSQVGSMYFLCPVSGHCAGGMKLAVNVVAASSNAPAPGGSTPGGTTSPRPPPPPPPPSSSGAVMNVWLMGVLGTIVVGFMV